MGDYLRHAYLMEILDEFVNELDKKVIKPFRKKYRHIFTISRYPRKASRSKISANK